MGLAFNFMPEVFATAATPPSVSTITRTEPSKVANTGDYEIPFTAYNNLKGHSYSAEYFDFIGTRDLRAVAGIREGIEVIDNYIKAQMEENDLNDTIDSYHEIMKGIMRHLNLSKNIRTDAKFMAIVNYLKLLNKEYVNRLPKPNSSNRLDKLEY